MACIMTSEHENPFHIDGLCKGYPFVTGGVPSQMASDVEL